MVIFILISVNKFSFFFFFKCIILKCLIFFSSSSTYRIKYSNIWHTGEVITTEEALLGWLVLNDTMVRLNTF